MNKDRKKIDKRTARRKRTRAKIFGTSERPRLSVFRSERHIFLQLVDDEKKQTLVGASDLKLPKTKRPTKTKAAFEAGRELAKLAKEKKIKKAVFDRGGYLFHGRVKAVAEGALAGGIEFKANDSSKI
ncbi:MAG: 50S ribosomal protein L18 [Patescibacteria group bacterium]